MMVVMGHDIAWAAADGQLDLASADAGLAILIEACERAVDQLGASHPSAQLRALLIIDQAGSMNLTRLAGALGTKAPAASKLCDRMELAGLLTRDRAAASRREIVLVPTESGRRLAQSVRESRRAALEAVLREMSPHSQEALVRGLRELAAAQPG
jgi:DNA-binding MarR family transcriptional regulator